MKYFIAIFCFMSAILANSNVRKLTTIQRITFAIPITNTEEYDSFQRFVRFENDEGSPLSQQANEMMRDYKSSHPEECDVPRPKKRARHIREDNAKRSEFSMNKHSPVLRYNFRASTIEKIFASNNLLQLSVKRSLSKNLKKKHH